MNEEEVQNLQMNLGNAQLGYAQMQQAAMIDEQNKGRVPSTHSVTGTGAT